MSKRKVFITGTAGFIGFHLAQLLLREGFIVCGFDGMTDYYDIGLKQSRHTILKRNPSFSAFEDMLENNQILGGTINAFAPDIIVHLAAQAGVRYSLENPRAYIESNIVGTFNVMEAAKQHSVAHLLMASTSSVYGANEAMPFRETDKTDMPLTIYSATKKANEAMAHSYAHLYDLPTTMFRFFTVYGPWGRPDMAPNKFTKAILEGQPIDIYNHGDMYRDFTYVEDLVHAIRLLIDVPPQRSGNLDETNFGDSLSSAAPFRVVNIGNSRKVKLLDFIETIEKATGCCAIRNYMDMQPGDVRATWAEASLLQSLTGYKPQTSLSEGVSKLVAWYRDYYTV